MKRIGTLSFVLLVALAALDPTAAFAQMTTVRGKVMDEDGNPLSDVKIEMEFKGESRVKIVRATTTDKRGGYVRSGLPSGNYKIVFQKEGFKQLTLESYISLGGLSELPEVKLPKAAAGPAPSAALAEGGVIPAKADAALAAKARDEYTKAVEATKAGQVDEAIALYKDILATFPDLPGAHYNLGFIYQGRKDWKAAEAEFARVAELQPTRPDAHIALAAVRELDGRGSEAVEAILKAAPAFAEDVKFQYALGLTCINVGRSPEAIAALEKVIALDPGQVEPYYHLGTLAVGANDVPGAIAKLEKYVSLTGQDPRNLETAKSLLAALKAKPKK